MANENKITATITVAGPHNKIMECANHILLNGYNAELTIKAKDKLTQLSIEVLVDEIEWVLTILDDRGLDTHVIDF